MYLQIKTAIEKFKGLRVENGRRLEDWRAGRLGTTEKTMTGLMVEWFITEQGENPNRQVRLRYICKSVFLCLTVP